MVCCTSTLAAPDLAASGYPISLAELTIIGQDVSARIVRLESENA